MQQCIYMKMDNKAGNTRILTLKDIQNVLIAQDRPSSDKSSYFDLERKFKLNLEFRPLIHVVPIPAKEFRKQKIDIQNYSAVIFMSKNAIDNFFRICEEMRINVSQEMKYFCITESIALYLQKFILYRKRKVFYGDNGTNQSLFETIKKYKEQERFLYPCSESFDSEITNWLSEHNFDYAIPVLYQVQSTNIKPLLESKDFQIVCLFTPLSIKSFLENDPDFTNNESIIATFGDNTHKAALAAGLDPEIVVPNENTRSMATALNIFLENLPGN